MLCVYVSVVGAKQRMKNFVVLLLLLLVVAIRVTPLNICDIVVVNSIHNNTLINFHAYNLNDGNTVYSKEYDTRKWKAFLVAFDPISQLFIYQTQLNELVILNAKNASLSHVVTLQPNNITDFRKGVSLQVIGNELFVLMSPDGSSKSDHAISQSANSRLYFIKINLQNGQVTRLFETEENSALMRVLAIGKNELFYVLGPYSSYALVSQNLLSGTVDNVVPIRDKDTGSILIATNIFYAAKQNALFAALYSELDGKSVLAMVDPDSGQYKEIFNFYEEWGRHTGKVMQGMAAFDDKNQILYGWFTNSEGSFSKLFAINIEEGRELLSLDYHDQEGVWKAVGFSC
jgi:hypothetical protein